MTEHNSRRPRNLKVPRRMYMIQLRSEDEVNLVRIRELQPDHRTDAAAFRQALTRYREFLENPEDKERLVITVPIHESTIDTKITPGCIIFRGYSNGDVCWRNSQGEWDTFLEISEEARENLLGKGAVVRSYPLKIEISGEQEGHLHFNYNDFTLHWRGRKERLKR